MSAWGHGGNIWELWLCLNGFHWQCGLSDLFFQCVCLTLSFGALPKDPGQGKDPNQYSHIVCLCIAVTTSSSDKMPGLKSRCYHLSAWTNDLTSLSIIFLLCNMGEILVLLPVVVVTMKWNDACKVFPRCLAHNENSLNVSSMFVSIITIFFRLLLHSPLYPPQTELEAPWYSIKSREAGIRSLPFYWVKDLWQVPVHIWIYFCVCKNTDNDTYPIWLLGRLNEITYRKMLDTY